jgi:hypothetical protein
MAEKFKGKIVPTESDINPQFENDDFEDVEFDFHTTVTDELYEDLVDRVGGVRVVGVALWEESLADVPDEAAPEPTQRALVDLDLYLENKSSMELYGVATYTDLEGEPLQGLDFIGQRLADLVEEGIWLDEVAVDEEDELVLVLTRNHQPLLYMSVGGWSLAEWDELPQAE